MRINLLLFVSILILGCHHSAPPKPLPAIPAITKPFDPVEKPLRGLAITVDPGHGGSSFAPGYSGSARGIYSRVVEGDLNMLVAGELVHYLRDAGADVFITRQDDRKVAAGASDRATELGARTKIADAHASHLFLAIHHNSTGRASANGTVILIWPTDSKGADQPLERSFADIMHDEVEKGVEHQQPFKHFISDHPLVHGSDIPSAVVEFGFLSNADFDAWVSQPGRHRDEARAAYNGVVRMWQEHHDELDALRKQLFPNPPARKPRRSEMGDDQAFVALAESLTLKSPPITTTDQAQRLISAYKEQVLSDKTLFYLNVNVELDGDTWILRGSANQPRVREAAARLLTAASGKPVRNEIELLPSKKLGDKLFGIVQQPMALTWSTPGEGKGVQNTQLLLGESVCLLDQNDEATYLLAHANDGYIGWVRADAIKRVDGNELDQWTQNRARLVRDVKLDDFTVRAGSRLPARLQRNGIVQATLPMPVRGAQGKDTFEAPAENFALPASNRGQQVAAAAMQYLTTPYIFGGRTKLGIDCSGLTGAAWLSAGVQLPRDANQQVLSGQLIATPWHRDTLQPGDQLFFIDITGKVFHTAISLGGSRFIHASPPEVQVSSFDPKDELYSEGWTKAFALAKRHAD